MKNSEVIFDLEQKKSVIASIDQDLASPDIWKDQGRLQSLQQNKKRLERELQSYSLIEEKKDELDVCMELFEEGENVEDEIIQILHDFTISLNEAELQTLFFERDDTRNAILSIHPGAGGTESQDWAQMLLRMYLRFSERKGYKIEILDTQHGEEAGIKKCYSPNSG